MLPGSAGAGSSQVVLPLQSSFPLYLPCLLKIDGKCLALGFKMRNDFIRAINLVLKRNTCFWEAIWLRSSFIHISCVRLKLIILCVSPVTKLGRIQMTCWVRVVGGGRCSLRRTRWRSAADAVKLLQSRSSF